MEIGSPTVTDVVEGVPLSSKSPTPPVKLGGAPVGRGLTLMIAVPVTTLFRLVRWKIPNPKEDLESRVLNSGDIILLASGGHGFEMLENTEIIEVKQGPFAGEVDKTRFKAKS